jgi:tetratricopeptide (TPR) repeat protein
LEKRLNRLRHFADPGTVDGRGGAGKRPCGWFTLASIPARLPVLAVILCLPPLLSAAGEDGRAFLWPEESLGESGQRGLDEIESVPTRIAACPVCSFPTLIPEADRLMLRPSATGEPVEWRMDASGRDSDFCPHPGRNKLSFRADLAVCPSCGYVSRSQWFDRPVSSALAAWALSVLRPEIRAYQKEFLGAGAAGMEDAEIADFFNRQEEIPDPLRLEHARVIAEARGDPIRTQAEATWSVAWALRRELASPPRGAVLRRLADQVREALLKSEKFTAGKVEEEAAALRRLISRSRRTAGKNAPTRPERLAAPLALAGLLDRLGFGVEAEEELAAAAAAFGERFARPEQDPLWAAASPRNRHSRRLEELEDIRREAERETRNRLELLRRERGYLEMAVDLIRQAILAGEYDGDPEYAFFHVYLAGDFLRRVGNFPLAAEWLKTLAALVPGDSPSGRAAENLLAILRHQAGDRVNLLSALGEDSGVFMKIREINRVGIAKRP